ncbi:hypothetical protein C3Y87_13035 [Carbonactinospora thermoautotrophica]|uniref:DUF1641 domain-containing protein n=1 Tax=Carbonactinospora thermoautotrophica TaxID=1469144 RepID=UPI00226E3A51|nr:DUF1641 domain-containing protein [Carbonactinospora thermoautotrophica]MCX9192318.1 hypothetical protein [Carbonactinospora thermoautotrophica]
MTIEGQLIAPSPVDALLSKLEEPRIVAALNDLLDHADLLAILLVGLNGLVRRGEVIGEAFADAVSELRGAASGASTSWEAVDLPKLASSLATLSSAVADATPALETLLRSDLTDPRVVRVISGVARALLQGAEQEKAEPLKPTGVFSLLRTLKDEDVARGLGFLIHVARAFGRELKNP